MKPRARKNRAFWRSGAAVRNYLRVDSTQLDSMRYPRNGQHVSRDPVVDAVRVREMHHVLKGLTQNELKLLIDGGFLPEIALAVLHPFKIGRGNAAGVGKNVWNDEDFFVGKDFIGGGRCGTVGAFADNLGLDPRRVLAGDNVFSGCRNQDVTVGKEELAGIGGVSAREADDGLVAIAVLQQSVNVDASTIEQAAIVFSDADDFVACCAEIEGRLLKRSVA